MRGLDRLRVRLSLWRQLPRISESGEVNRHRRLLTRVKTGAVIISYVLTHTGGGQTHLAVPLHTTVLFPALPVKFFFLREQLFY